MHDMRMTVGTDIHQDALDSTKSTVERQGDAHFDAVSVETPEQLAGTDYVDSGLDNAGKTTIVKRVMNEDVNTVSPTLGFNIKTIDFQGFEIVYLWASPMMTNERQIQIEHLGCWRSEDHSLILEELL